MSQTHRAFLMDSQKCLGCRACVMACKSYNKLPPYMTRRFVYTLTADVYPFEERAFYSLSCNHCATPSCLAVCPARAFSVRSDGIVVLDTERCTGCTQCVEACLYRAIHFDPATRKAHKCDMCHARLDAGYATPCVMACPVGALQIIDLNTHTSAIQYPARFPYRPELNPSTRFVLPRPPRCVLR